MTLFGRLRALPLFPLLALVAGVVLLQWHGGQFWAEKTGSIYWGWGASATLEWLALWAWHTEARAEARGAGFWEQGARALAAGAVTALLIAGPLYQVGSPLLKEARETIALANRVDRTDAALDTLKRASDRGRKVGEQIAQLTIEANDAEAQAYGADAMGRRALPGMERLLIGAQLVALVMFSVGVVAGIRTLGRGINADETTAVLPVADQFRQDAVHTGKPMESGLETGRSESSRIHAPSLETLGLPKETVRKSEGKSGNGSHVAALPESPAQVGPSRHLDPWQHPHVAAHPLTVRVRAMLLAWDVRHGATPVRQVLAAQDPAVQGSIERDLSLCRNHPARVLGRNAGRTDEKIITENSLARLERLAGTPAVEPQQPTIPTDTHVRSL